MLSENSIILHVLFHYAIFLEFCWGQILEDVSGYGGLSSINQGYLDIAEALEFVPVDGTYIVPYVANAAGVLYNREMFAQHVLQNLGIHKIGIVDVAADSYDVRIVLSDETGL